MTEGQEKMLQAQAMSDQLQAMFDQWQSKLSIHDLLDAYATCIAMGDKVTQMATSKADFHLGIILAFAANGIQTESQRRGDALYAGKEGA